MSEITVSTACRIPFSTRLLYDVATGRFAYQYGKDIDLCRACIERYELDELKELMGSCHDHNFFELSMAEAEEVGSTSYTSTVLSVEQWLQDLADKLLS
jgi:hypothetical protein